MANLNVLPQVSAKPIAPKNGVKGEVQKDSPKGVELSKEFEKTLSHAADQKKPVDNAVTKDQAATQASEKEASEKAAALLLQASMTATPQLEVKADSANPQEEPLKGGSLLGAKDQTGVKNLKENLQAQLAQATDPKAAAEKLAAETNAKALDGQSVAKQSNPAQAKLNAENAFGTGAMNGMSLSGLSEDYAFDLESLDVKEGTSFSDAATELKPRVPSSKLSTSDFMNLRDLSQNSVKNPLMSKDSISAQNQELKTTTLTSAGIGMKAVTMGKDKKSGLEEAADARQAPVISLDRSNHFNGKVIDAPVTQGSGDKLVLSHDALSQISNQVNLMSQAKQDGEIKIRLRPDHLGEMHMSIKTQGQMVTIQIHARDGEAKKIIEESLGSLRDSLSSQNLTLSRIDVVTQPAQTAQSDQGLQLDMGQRQNNDQSSSFQQEPGARQDRSFEDGLKTVNLMGARQAANLRSRSSSANGLDLIA